jgi:hypothetical protein
MIAPSKPKIPNAPSQNQTAIAPLNTKNHDRLSQKNQTAIALNKPLSK